MTRLGLLLAALVIAAPLPAGDYDPLTLPDAVAAEPLDLTIHDRARRREIPIRVYLPASKSLTTRPAPASQPTSAAAPVILFSHGLGGSRENNGYLGRHWSGRGYAVVFLQHAGSDEAVWKDIPRARRLAAMKQAASAENFTLRVKDVPAALDQLAAWHAETGHALHGRLDLGHVGMSGHSFGAVTTQAVSGQAFGPVSLTDPRIDAALPMSPSAPRRGTPGGAFGAVKLPWLLMTGTDDTSPINDTTVERRLAVFPALPAGDKFELVLFEAEHSAFGERALPGERRRRNPNHHRAILALSTAFWEAYLREDTAAKAWLTGPGPRRVLEEKDRWQAK